MLLILRLLPILVHISQILGNPAPYFPGLGNMAYNHFSPYHDFFFELREASAAYGVAGCPRRMMLDYLHAGVEY